MIRCDSELDVLQQYEIDQNNKYYVSSSEYYCSHGYDKDCCSCGTTLTVQNLCEAKQALQKANVPMSSNWIILDDPYEYVNYHSLDTLTVSNNNNCKEEAMCYDTNTPVDQAQKFIKSRLYDLKWEKNQELREFFKMDGIYPKNKKEAEKWFKEGNYRLMKEWEVDDEDDFGCGGNLGLCTRWGKDEPDQKAFDKAVEAMSESYQNALDTVTIVTDEQKRLDILNEFKSATFH